MYSSYMLFRLQIITNRQNPVWPNWALLLGTSCSEPALHYCIEIGYLHASMLNTLKLRLAGSIKSPHVGKARKMNGSESLGSPRHQPQEDVNIDAQMAQPKEFVGKVRYCWILET